MATIIFYADHFNYIAEAGEEAANSLMDAVDLIEKINTRSFPNYAQLNKTVNAVKSRTDLSNEMRFIKNKITKDAYNQEYYRDSFLGLFFSKNTLLIN